MAIYVHAPLPGPFTVSKRIGGRRKTSGSTTAGILALLYIAPIFVLMMTWWLALAVFTALGTVTMAYAVVFSFLPGRTERFVRASKPFLVPVKMWRLIVKLYRKMGL